MSAFWDINVNQENVFSDYVSSPKGEKITVSITGVGVSTIFIQVLLTGKLIPQDVDFTLDEGRYEFNAGNEFDKWRVGCKIGGYTSGAREVRIEGKTVA